MGNCCHKNCFFYSVFHVFILTRFSISPSLNDCLDNIFHMYVPDIMWLKITIQYSINILKLWFYSMLQPHVVQQNGMSHVCNKITYRFSPLYLRHRYIDDPLTLKKISEIKKRFNLFFKYIYFKILDRIAHMVNR